MKIESFASLAINMVVCVLLAAAGCRVGHAAPEVRFQLVRGALILVPVTVDDEGPFYFVLDTGADTTIVDAELAKRLSLSTLQSARQVTITGSQIVNVSRLARLSLGTVLVEGLPVLVNDLSSLQRMDGRIVGIVGQDFLSHFDYLLDYRARSLHIEKDDEIRGGIDGDSTPLEAGQTRMIVAAEAQARGHVRLRLLLDSGANAFVLIGAALNGLHCPMVRQGVESSLAGTAILRMGRVNLTVGSHEFHDLPVSFRDDAPSQGIGDGLLPAALFDGLYVSNSKRFVILNPHARKTTNLRTERQEAALDGMRDLARAKSRW